VAYVQGRVHPAAGTWRNWLKLSDDELRQFIVPAATAQAEPGEVTEAITHYAVIEEFTVGTGPGVVTKLRLRLETGRKHQIRVQAAHAGVPLLGDRTYHPRYRALAAPKPLLPRRRADAPHPPRLDFPRQALHAAVLRLEHPDRPGTQLAWTAALPKDMQQLEALLRRGGLSK
jgi:23S rRNA pseudouridine1911/1915/1917 synthase